MQTLLQKYRFNTGFLAGLLAGLVATGLMLLLSVTLGGISLPEVFGAALTQLMPPSLFNTLHELIGGDAKHYFFYGIIVGQCLVFALCGGFCTLLTGSIPRLQKAQGQLRWLAGIVLAIMLWLLTSLVFLPLTGAGFFGMDLIAGVINTMLSLAVVGITFGMLFVFLQNWFILRSLRKKGLTNKDLAEADQSRRVVLQRTFQVIGLGIFSIVAWRFISGTGEPSSSQNVAPPQLLQRYKKKIVPAPTPNYGEVKPAQFLSAEVTPNDRYYIVSKNLFSDPKVSGESWRLRVDGQVEHPYTLTYAEITALPLHEQYESMMCISNEVGGQYMSNARWEGVSLADLLARAGGVKQGAAKVVLYAADDYSDSIHLSKALEPTTMVALRMNGETLPQGHGFPARLLVPGIYGMKHVKWITRIEVLHTDFQGYWQQRGWSDAAPIRMTARIDTPLIGSTLSSAKETAIAGVAFSGNKGISEVDVSFDQGQTWQRTTLKQPLSALTWVLWEFLWQPQPGTYTIIARAIDLEGNVQDPQLAPPLPDGSSGYHSINVTVR